VPDSAARISHIAFPSGDEVNMAVGDSLAGRRADIDADIESVDARIPLQQYRTGLVQERVTGGSFVIIQVKVRNYVTTGDDEGVKFRHRGGVQDCHSHRILADDAFVGQAAEYTGFMFGCHVSIISRIGHLETSFARCYRIQ